MSCSVEGVADAATGAEGIVNSAGVGVAEKAIEGFSAASKNKLTQEKTESAVFLNERRVNCGAVRCGAIIHKSPLN